jgi:two-component system sensor histidine kinase ArlS
MIKILKFKKISWKLTLIYSVIFSLVLVLLNAGILYGIRFYLIKQSETQVNNSCSAAIKDIINTKDLSDPQKKVVPEGNN